MTEPTFFDLFAGAGGLSLGLGRAGWQGLLAVDHWGDAVDTYRENLHHPIENQAIQDLSGKDLLRQAGERPNWIVGGPPCQGYSTVGRRSRDDERNRLFLEFRRIVDEVRPQGVVIENVRGLKDMAFEAAIADSFQEIGYRTRWFVVTSADYGVPQLRRRVIFVGHVERGAFGGIPPTHDPGCYVTVDDAIGDLPQVLPGQTVTRYETDPYTTFQKAMRDGEQVLQGHTASNHPAYLVEAISHIPDGGNRRSIPDHLQPRSGYHNSYARLSSRAPAVAVTSNMGKPSATRCIHPFQNRGLTAREGARLQSFPDRFHFVGGITSQRLQIANAVPPLLSEALGNAIERTDLWT